MRPRVKNWRACQGVHKHTGRIKRGYRARRGQCPLPVATARTVPAIDLLPAASFIPGLGAASKRSASKRNQQHVAPATKSWITAAQKLVETAYANQGGGTAGEAAAAKASRLMIRQLKKQGVAGVVVNDLGPGWGIARFALVIP